MQKHLANTAVEVLIGYSSLSTNLWAAMEALSEQ